MDISDTTANKDLKKSSYVGFKNLLIKKWGWKIVSSLLRLRRDRTRGEFFKLLNGDIKKRS